MSGPECWACYAPLTPNAGAMCPDCETEEAELANPEGVVVFDLETPSADELYSRDPVEFARLAGYTQGDARTVEPGPDGVTARVLRSKLIIGSNHMAFDLPALARVDSRVDLLTLARDRRVFDCMIADSVMNPILNEKRPGEIGRAMRHFKLDAMAERYGVPKKVDDIKRLAKEHGGYDQIPVDDPEYREYCEGDLVTTTGVAKVLLEQLARQPERVREYLWREHRVHAIAATMGLEGLAVDQELLQRRYWTTAERKSRRQQELIKKFDIPTMLASGKPADSPSRTKDGKIALLRAFHSLGVRVAPGQFPYTKPTEAYPGGQPAFGREVMGELAERYAEHPNAETIGTLCELIGDIAGSRTVYATALAALCPDGRVHPKVVTFQASGRWSVSDPGLTVFGKRGGKVVERAIFTARDLDHVLMAIDLSQIDARTVAVHSQDHAYMDLFGIDPDTGKPLDAHELVGRMVWGDAVYDSDIKRYREQIKGITHGLPYGMGIDRLIGHAKVTEDVARRVVDTMNERFPRMQEWKREVREWAGSGAAMDNGFGRILRARKEDAYTQGPALMGQSGARDLMMKCLLNVDDTDAEVTRMLRAQVHDEAIFEFPRKDAEELKRLVERCFTFEWAPDPSFRPIKIIAEGSHFGYRWSECY